jgi:hypothetical protein
LYEFKRERGWGCNSVVSPVMSKAYGLIPSSEEKKNLRGEGITIRVMWRSLRKTLEVG